MLGQVLDDVAAAGAATAVKQQPRPSVTEGLDNAVEGTLIIGLHALPPTAR